MSAKLDEKDLAILTLIQENSKLTANQIAKKISSPLTSPPNSKVYKTAST